MKAQCSICKEEKYIRIPNIGISFGMFGEDYNLCFKCSKLSFDAIIRKIAKKYGFKYPLKLKVDEK